MFTRILCVAAGGALGSVSRYLVVVGMSRHVAGAFPWWTLAVNAAGSFLIGFVARIFYQGFPGHEFYWLFAVVGFLGGFTTFSAFSYELLLMLQKQQYALFALNVSLHAAGCLAAVIAGYHVSKIIFS
ncbi:MAG: fluoride efflux transporter CrcB [Candidatus Omnitrophica bacterium CG12_big_fil_rev_8_21_14_0_65_50_5]|nr:MAG: fluoride efflux transporter CrcB [Candidatus Omnitrophica bacterium CG12_big_fil_rev_8_21_14_0_65_50_5]